MTLSHYTDEKPWTFSAERRPLPNSWDHLHKPHGLWLSVDGEDDWPSWCEGEGWRLESLRQRHVFEITKPERVHLIGSVDELDEFHERYAVARTPELEARWGREYIDWAHVMQEHGGIIITPYLWDRRLSGPGSRWYYGWDCASGCIWDLSAVRHVRSEPFALREVVIAGPSDTESKDGK